ncbi:MAG: hypothetical protein A2W93_09290 [Bacteroidetes bacterium GWF2_43_63]|nr:MAG: hypothetical protein A2W94_05670 [Bacteroidetes bacterium GWE2_42_42]OFY54490.1 MAG: hypothetical protein A2W93_09290 [Bacteroidetes bacterium GWF2_43_63]HBG70439.1 hypothetical protein [Bacteroidales bacterium]HCB63444.1 hypothetical protein [Bacteroidales bacterium]
MKQKFLSVFFFLCVSLIPYFMEGQEKDTSKVELNSGADIMSRYVWRGSDFGSSPSIQPTVSLTGFNFTFGVWGAFATNNFSQAQETDLFLTYTLKDKIDITVTDYFFPNETPGAFNNYFEYNDSLSGHIFEGTIKWKGTEELPLSFLVAANFYGADTRHADGKLFYSTYMELCYSGKCGSTSYDLFAGFTPNKPNDADKLAGVSRGFYGNTMGFVNLGLKVKKDVKISGDFTLPLSTSFIVNPMAENIFLVFGFTL